MPDSDDDIIMRGLAWLAPPAIQVSAEELEALALGEYLQAVGRVMLVRVAQCMVGADSREVLFDPPARFRVTRTSREDLCHWNDEWLDPYWNIEPVDPVDHDGRSWWVHGPSRNLNTGAMEPCNEWSWEVACSA